MRLLFEVFREHASVAQLVEQLTLNQWVEGSSPSGRTRFLPLYLITPSSSLINKLLILLFISLSMNRISIVFIFTLII